MDDVTTIEDRAWQAFLDLAWRPDFDGSAADDAAGEPRGNTHWGVVRATWAGAFAFDGVTVSNSDFDTAPQSDFAKVLRWACWNAIDGDRLAQYGRGGTAIVLANMAMAAGARQAVLLLQRTLGTVVVDGVMGPVTRLATCARGQPLIDDLTNADDVFFAGLRTAPLYLHGWTRRAEAFRAAADAFAARGFTFSSDGTLLPGPRA